MADLMCLLLAMFGQLFIRESHGSLLGVELDETGQRLLNEYLSLDEDKYLTELHQFRDTAVKIDSIDRKRKHRPVHQPPRILYQVGDSEEELPECSDRSEVCSKVDLYGSPWVERQCRCPDGRACPSSLHGDDGHTIVDKTRQYKLCEPVKHLPICRYFKEWVRCLQRHYMDLGARRRPGERDRSTSLLPLSAQQRALSSSKTSAQISRGKSRIYLCFRVFSAKQTPVSTQRALSTVHRTQETDLATRRSERVAPLPMSEGSSMSQTSHGSGFASGKILFRCLGD